MYLCPKHRKSKLFTLKMQTKYVIAHRSSKPDLHGIGVLLETEGTPLFARRPTNLRFKHHICHFWGYSDAKIPLERD